MVFSETIGVCRGVGKLLRPAVPVTRFDQNDTKAQVIVTLSLTCFRMSGKTPIGDQARLTDAIYFGLKSGGA